METKCCNQCGLTKTLDLFNRQPRGKYGVNSKCKSCVNKNTREKYTSTATIYNRVGERYTTKEGYEIEIIKYKNSHDCDVLFLRGTHTVSSKYYREIINGSIKNPFHKSVLGVGYFGQGGFSSEKNKKAYIAWVNVLQRGYYKEYKLKNPTYKDVTVCEEWHDFQVFAKWYEENYVEGWHLDKDILVKGNKTYSPETCCFVPREINNLFVVCNKNRGDLPIGVRKEVGYSARINKKGKNIYLGTFDTIEEAFNAYKVAKEIYIKEIAYEWREQITEEVYQALINYQVEITD